jgi:hypothetical protein
MPNLPGRNFYSLGIVTLLAPQDPAIVLGCGSDLLAMAFDNTLGAIFIATLVATTYVQDIRASWRNSSQPQIVWRNVHPMLQLFRKW